MGFVGPIDFIPQAAPTKDLMDETIRTEPLVNCVEMRSNHRAVVALPGGAETLE